MMEWAVEQSRCDVKEAKVAGELIEAMCDSKKWNIGKMNASEWGTNLHPVGLKKGSCEGLESQLLITVDYYCCRHYWYDCVVG